MERIEFDKKRDAWRKGISSNKALGASLAQAALAQFANHQDTSFIQDFYSDLTSAGKNYVRASAYRAWLTTFVPVKMEANKWIKDHELAAKLNWDTGDDDAKRATREALVSKAEAKSFFDFAPEAVVQNYQADTVVVTLTKALAKFEDSKHYKAENEDAVAMLARAKSVVASLKSPEAVAA